MEKYIITDSSKSSSWTNTLSKAGKIDRTIGRLLNKWKITEEDWGDFEEDWGDFEEDIKLLKSHVELLRRQAQKAKNQRKTLKQLHKAHQAIIMENRWLRETMVNSVYPFDSGTMKKVLKRAKETLWNQFKKETSKK